MQVSKGTHTELDAIHQKRRLDIDALRGFAVLAVLTYHFFPQVSKSGFVGVDVFFVISGFVITNLLIRKQFLNAAALKSFWAHRVRRIFPALALVLSASLILGWFILWPAQYQVLGISATWSALMIPNILFWTQDSYFATEPTANPLLNLWSLGIEEQFYLVWPIIVLIVLRYFRGLSRLILVIGLAFSSWLACLVLPMLADNSAQALTSVFYLPWFRAWELLAGAALAFGILHPPRMLKAIRVSSRAAASGYWTCTAVLVIYVILPMPFTNPALFATLPVLLTVLLIGLRMRMSTDANDLSRSPLLWFGRISYPLYLWHWPILAFGLALGLTQSLVTMLSLLVLSIGLGWLTKSLVEQPIQRIPIAAPVVTVIVLCLLAAAVGGWIVGRNNGFPSRASSPVAKALVNYSYDFAADYQSGTCFSPTDRSSGPWPIECLPSVDSPERALLAGDSHAAHLSFGLKALSPGPESIGMIAAGACAPLLSQSSVATRECEWARGAILKEIESGTYSDLILAASWKPADVDELSRTLELIKQVSPANELNITIVGPVPVWRPSLPRVWSFLEANRMSELPLTTWHGVDMQPFELDTKLRQVAADNGVNYVSALESLCDASGCKVRDPKTGEPMAWDRDHLTRSGSRIIGRSIEESLSRSNPPANSLKLG